jgi:hypothetical protein
MTVYGNAPILRSRWELTIGHRYPAIPNIFFGKVREQTSRGVALILQYDSEFLDELILAGAA